MSVHDENNATVYKCKNCNKNYTDHFSKEEIQKHVSGQCIRGTSIINIRTKKPYDVYCGRESIYYKLEESPFCNPFRIGQHGTREEVIEKFKNYFYKRLAEDADFNYKVWQLKGKVLGCWCKPQPCHCDIIIDFLDKDIKKDKPWLKKVLQDASRKNVAVIGSRDWTDKKAIFDVLDKNKEKIKMIVSGGAFGADSIANEYAKKNGLSILIHYPDWLKGKTAGFERNTKIIQDSDIILAFQLNSSRGTQDSIDKARQLGKKVIVYTNNIEKTDE